MNRVIFLRKGIIIFFLCAGVLFNNHLVSAQTRVEISDKGDLVKLIVAKYQTGNWEAGKEITETSLKKYPNDSDLKMLLGKYYVNAKKYDNARYELNKAIEYNPANVDAKQLLVGVETETKRYSSAICYVNELLEVNPYWKGLWQKKIDLYRLQGNDVEATRLLTRISQIFPNDKKFEKDIAYELEQKSLQKRKEGKIDDAIKLSNQLLNLSSGSSENFVTLIDNYIKAGDYNQALVTADRGLNKFPRNGPLVKKKISLLEQLKRYDEVLSFIQTEMKRGGNPALRTQYNYFLLEAARNGKEKDPLTLYGKILAGSPSNDEAFNYVFDHDIAAQQYDEALYLLNRYRKVRGNSKKNSLKELRIYKSKGDTKMVAKLSKALFTQYPTDEDLRAAYVKVVLQDAKDKMQSGEYLAAVAAWREVSTYGGIEEQNIADMGMFNAYSNLGQLNDALNILNEIIADEPTNVDLYLKRADIYAKQKRYSNALLSYEKALSIIPQDKKEYYLSGYGDMMTTIIKALVDEYKYPEALQYTENWLAQDPKNQQALFYAINFSSKMEDFDSMEKYAVMAHQAYPLNTAFKVKLAEAVQKSGKDFSEYWLSLEEELKVNPYNETVSKAFTALSTSYGQQLVKNNKLDEALSVYSSASSYDPKNKELKYLKGIVFEKLHQVDSAYYYQSFYEPSIMEAGEFKQHLFTLNQKRLKNEIGIYHLRARYGDNYAITSVSTIEYTRKNENNSYVGRINYAGRENGRGLQIQGEYSRKFFEGLSGMANLALSDRFFPKINANISVYKSIFKKYELEAGLGYRKLDTKQNLTNLVLGITRELEDFRLNARYNQFLLDGKLLYNLSAQGRYFMNGPRNYLMVTASVGSSPDVDLIDTQNISSFSILNTMVGSGIGHIINKNVSAGILGTWYNFNDGTGTTIDPKFRNLYNLYFQLNVSF